MAAAGVDRPKRLDERYLALTEDGAEGDLFCLFRADFHLSIDEVKALPWYERRLLTDFLYRKYRDPDAHEVVPGDADGLGALGVTVGTA